ncbi:amino acid ABC transporter permease [Acetonema longum]|uniref:Sulfur-containing amino acid ABC transporter permease TcyL n=1 Tax=Acetonema longum DSM 6540 TaxID=1009370 RepID=F7NJ85_9FIRM|nr:amino acid ABC transporter permease [Acetonema longum]EGO63833.1 sulfur-containing amino acid ABC transporter permease TcyL [Acetonema longum DSM 6540]
MGSLFDIRLVFEYFPSIVSRFHITLLIVVFSLAVGTLLGFMIAMVRLYRLPVLNRLALVYVSFIRGTPVIIQLFIVYYGLPLLLETIGLDINHWDKLYFVLVAYGFNNAAFMSEIIRSAIASVPAGQREAAYSVGLSRWQALHRVILPQAFLTAFPVFGTRVVDVFESTSLAFTLGILDMVGQAEAIGNRTYHELEGYVVLAVIFIAVSLLLETLFTRAEKTLIANRR